MALISEKRRKLLLQKALNKKLKAEAKGSKAASLEVKEVRGTNAGLKKRIKPNDEQKVNPRLTLAKLNTLEGLTEAIDAKFTDLTRETMNEDIQVLVLRPVDNQDLIKLHFKEIESAIKSNSTITDEEKKQYLEYISSTKNIEKLSKEFHGQLYDLVSKALKSREGSTIAVKRFKSTTILGQETSVFIIQKTKNVKDSAYEIINKRIIPIIKQNILNNSNKSVKSSILSIIVCGFDLKSAPSIGRAGIGGAAKNIVLGNAPVDPSTNKKQPGAGFQLGHLRGSLIINAERAKKLFHNFAQEFVQLRAAEAVLDRKFNIVETHDAETELNLAVLNFVKGKFSGNANFSIFRFEGAAPNSLSGFIAQQASNEMRRWMRDKAIYLLTAESSPSIANLILDDVINAFFGIENTNRFKRKVKRRGKVKSAINTTKLSLAGKINKSSTNNLNKALNQDSEESSNINDLTSLLNFLNSKMHDKIRENMGKGGSKQVLNYRTGRFAKSAKIQSLYEVNEKRAIGAQVKYMRYPYGVFEPGGRLHKAGRDPHRIFGRSIRQILQEERIANLRRVKVKLNG